MSKTHNNLLKYTPAASSLRGAPNSALGFALANANSGKSNHQAVRPLARRWLKYYYF